MNSTRIISFTLCLGLACLLLTGNAMAQTTVADEVDFAREVGEANALFSIPAAIQITRTMAVLRVGGGSGNFFVRVSLSNNAEFDAVGTGSLPAAGNLAQSGGLPATNVTVTLPTAVVQGDTFVDYLVEVKLDFTTFPSFTLATADWGVQDVDNVLGGGGTISVTLATRDSNTGTGIDVGTDTDAWLNGIYAVTVADSLVATTAVIDVATARTDFAVTAPDTASTDIGATVGIHDATAGAFALDGVGSGAYALLVGDTINVVITGDLSGISGFIWDTGGGATGRISLNAADAAFDLANGTATIAIAGTNSAIGDTDTPLYTVVDGTSTLGPRTLQVAINLDVATSGPTANDRVLVAQTNMTVWSLNGTVLIAGFVNGNTTLFNSRVYLYNSGSLAGDVTVRVFTLPLTGASTILGTANLGSLPALSGKNIRVAEDVLTPMSVALPYTADGGNLVLEITVEASTVTGKVQVFQLDLTSFGIYNLEAL